MEKTKPPSYEEVIAGFTEMEKTKPPSFEEAIAGFTEMEKIEPPSYEDAISAGSSPHSAKTNTAYVLDRVFQQVPTVPTIGTIGSSGPPIMSLVSLTDPELRVALRQRRKDFCCYGSKFIREMILTDIQNDYAFHHKLELFGEKRECTPKFTGYYGQTIDGPEKDGSPDKWKVPVGVPIKFVDHQITMEVPHTAYVKECSTCEGGKKIDCTPCWASGMVNCSKCGGRGKDAKNFDCWICRGSGKEECLKCSGSKVIDCPFCDGFGKVKYYMQLTVTWKRHVDETVSNSYNLPEKNIFEASGREIFINQANQVEPLNTIQDTFNEASNVLREKLHSSIRNEAIIAQRHSARAVPLTKATYIWRKQKGEFYVYGFERKVYFKDYPQRSSRCALS